MLVVLLGAPASAQQQDCSIVGQNNRVRDILVDFYLWYRELPDVDPALFDSPETYLEAVRFRPLDDRFSFITGLAEFEAFNQNNELVGFGFSLTLTGGDLRLLEVYPGSAAWDAGLRRGDFILEIDRRGITEILEAGQLGRALGPNEAGVTREFRWRKPWGATGTAAITKRVFTISTVGQTAVIDVDGLPVGYINFRNFSEPSFDALDRVFAGFQSQGVTDLVLDLRYNGGGLVEVARHLGSLIGGLRTNTKVFAAIRHNDKHTDLDRELRFEDPPATLDLPRVVVITSGSSASASELVVNGLEPFILVTLVGDRTFGKPVGQLGFDFCEKIFFPVAFKTVNAHGEGDFFDGIPVDCPARDDLNRGLGDRNETSLAEALHFLETGRCTARAVVVGETLRAQREQAPLLEPRGFRLLTNNAW